MMNRFVVGRIEVEEGIGGKLVRSGYAKGNIKDLCGDRTVFFFFS